MDLEQLLMDMLNDENMPYIFREYYEVIPEVIPVEEKISVEENLWNEVQIYFRQDEPEGLNEPVMADTMDDL